jgi:predicted transcriptional regulator
MAATRTASKSAPNPDPTLAKGRRVTGTERTSLAKDLTRRYAAGESIRALAEATGRSYGFVHRVLTESGATLRGRGGSTRTRKT